MLEKNLFQNCLLMGYIFGSNKIQSLKRKCKSYIRRNDGVTAVEYAIVVAGVAAIVLAVFGSSGPVQSMLTDTFDTLKTKVSGLIGGGGAPSP